MRRFFSFWCFFIITSFLSVYSQINTDRLISNGRNALYFEDYVLSIQYFNQVIRVKPFLAEPYFYRGVAKINLEDYNGAEQDCSLALERNPFIVNAYECRGIARLNLNKTDLAVEDFNKALEFSPQNKRYQFCKGVAYLHGEKYENAITELTNAIQLDKKFIEAYINRGRAYLSVEDTLKALADFDKALSLDKFRPECYASKGIVLYMQGNYKEALSCYDEAIRLKPDRPGFYINRALIRYAKKDLRGSKSDYDYAVQIDPDNILAHYNRGLLLNEVGDRNNALSDFNKVLDLDPSDDMALYNRALIETEIGELDDAISDINALLQLHPDFYPLYYNRAEAKKLKGDKKGANLDYNQAYLMEREGKKNKSNSDNSKSREKKDKNLNKFKRLVIADADDEERRFSYKSETRGHIQNVNYDIQIEPIFFLSYYIKNSEIQKYYFFDEVNKINKNSELSSKLLIGNKEKKISNDVVAEHFHKVPLRTKILEQKSNDVIYIARALDYEIVCAFQNALEDYNKAAELSPNNWIIYFNRANIRHKQIETTNKEDIESNVVDLNLQYKLIIDDYKQVIKLCPQMYFAYFNIGNILLEEKNYSDAVIYFDEAIKMDKSFGEAYFNRGLTYIFLGETQKGIADLSKAGELGIYSSYNIIKRYTSND